MRNEETESSLCDARQGSLHLQLQPIDIEQAPNRPALAALDEGIIRGHWVIQRGGFFIGALVFKHLVPWRHADRQAEIGAIDGHLSWRDETIRFIEKWILEQRS